MKTNDHSLLALMAIAGLFLLTMAATGCQKETADQDGPVPAKDQRTKSLSGNARKIPVVDTPFFVVDQFNTTILKPFSFNETVGIGQEFTPQLHALDAIVLNFDDASCSLAGSNGGDVRLLIRKGTLDGAILATSNTLHFPNCFRDTARFDFPAFVPLEPGQVYLIQPQYAGGHSAAFFLNDFPSTYQGGRFILAGVAEENRDLWFREGLYHFIARTKDQAKNGGWKNLVRKDGTPFRNMGDCLQYINKGQ